MEPVTGYLMSADKIISRIDEGEIIEAEEALLPLYLKRTGNKVNFETFDGLTGEDDDYSRCYCALLALGGNSLKTI